MDPPTELPSEQKSCKAEYVVCPQPILQHVTAVSIFFTISRSSTSTMAIIKTLVAALAFFMSASAFTVQPLRSGIAKASSTRLQVGGPLQKLLNKDDYNQKIDNIMKQKKLTREQAEKEYDSYLDDPNSYALQKGELSFSEPFVLIHRLC